MAAGATPNPVSDWQTVAPNDWQTVGAAAPTASVSAQPPSQHPVQDWLHNLNSDLTEGGNRTLPGRILGHMQGRGNEGYTGLNSGGQGATAQFMGSPVLGPVHAAQGIAETPQHPVMGSLHALEGAAQTFAIPSSIIDPEINPAMSTGSKILDAVPTRAKAGRLFDQAMETARDQPVTISPSTMQPLERTQQLAMAGGKPFSTADKLYQRTQSINPLTYGEARDFSSNMSLSPEEKMGLKKSMKYEVPRLSSAFNDDVQQAADAAGVGAEHAKAMKMYSRASRNAAIGNGLVKYGGRAALGAAGAGGLYELGKIVNK